MHIVPKQEDLTPVTSSRRMYNSFPVSVLQYIYSSFKYNFVFKAQSPVKVPAAHITNEMIHKVTHVFGITRESERRESTSDTRASIHSVTHAVLELKTAAVFLQVLFKGKTSFQQNVHVFYHKTFSTSSANICIFYAI